MACINDSNRWISLLFGGSNDSGCFLFFEVLLAAMDFMRSEGRDPFDGLVQGVRCMSEHLSM